MNRVLLMGRLSFEPDLRKTQAGLSVCNLSLASTERVENRTNDGKKTHTEFHKLVAWGGLADLCARNLRKGSSVFVEGKLRTETYEKDGVKVKSTKIVVDSVRFLDAREDDSLPPVSDAEGF